MFTTRSFTFIVIISNLILGVLLYLSSQLLLFNFNGAAITGFNIFSVYGSPTQVSGQVIAPIAVQLQYPYYPFYVLLLFLVVNAVFTIKVLVTKSDERNIGS